MLLPGPVAARGLVNGRGPQAKCSGRDGAQRKASGGSTLSPEMPGQAGLDESGKAWVGELLLY